jgi:cytidylate kinase
VIDGRDIGTVVCPDATAKLFVDARPEARAHRRWLELKALGQTPKRPPSWPISGPRRRGTARAVAPLKPAADAALLDTSAFGYRRGVRGCPCLGQPKVEEALKARPRG